MKRRSWLQGELADALANRFLLCACRRARLLPKRQHRPARRCRPDSGARLARSDTPAPPDAYAWTSKHASCGAARTPSSPPANPPASPRALCAGSEVHTIRLALLCALADGEPIIKTEQLGTALALCPYAARSAG